ncbi:MAG: hypothetical protein M1335_08315 [Chloroflexi bacterium]|nr:hypothetical protein [Chloroflexota bacterium]
MSGEARRMDGNRTVLILTAETGSGHKSVSSALRECFSSAYPQFDLAIVDAYRELFEFPLSLINPAHRQIVRYSPAIWSLLFESTYTGKRFSTLEGLTRPFSRDRVEELFDRTNPAVVISVIPIINSLIGDVAKKRGIPFVVVVTDMARVHPAWFSKNASRFCVPTEFAKSELVRLGACDARVEVTGLPIRLNFFTKASDRQALREKLGMSEEGFAVLMMGGGEGVGVSDEAIEEVVSLPGIEGFVFTGRNERFKKKIERRFGSKVTTLGFVENVDEWLKAADLLVTKPGACTVVEAGASHVPTLFVGALPGQEQSIVDSLLLALSAGERLICGLDDISARIEELMNSEEKRRELADSILDYASPAAAAKICLAAERLIGGTGTDRPPTTDMRVT